MFYGDIEKEEKEVREFYYKQMRRGLYEFLWGFRQDAKGENKRPCPRLSDLQIKVELKRLLK